MKITLFVLALNEIDGMKAIMPKIPIGMFEQILVVDGQSTDGTAQWAAAQGYEVYVQKKRGIRFGFIEAWPLIKSDYVMTFSPDGNCKTEDLHLLIAKLAEGYDMVIASRYLAGSKSEDDDAVTGMGNWMFTKLINFLHKANYTDAMTIFRAYRTNLFLEANLHKEETYYIEKFFGTIAGIEPLLSVRAAKMKLKVGEVPSIEPKRIYGLRKLQVFRWGATYLCQVILEKFSRA